MYWVTSTERKKEQGIWHRIPFLLFSDNFIEFRIRSINIFVTLFTSPSLYETLMKEVRNVNFSRNNTYGKVQKHVRNTQVLENLSSPAGFKLKILELYQYIYFLTFYGAFYGAFKMQKLGKVLKFVISKILDPPLQSFKELIKYLIWFEFCFSGN